MSSLIATSASQNYWLGHSNMPGKHDIDYQAVSSPALQAPGVSKDENSEVSLDYRLGIR